MVSVNSPLKVLLVGGITPDRLLKGDSGIFGKLNMAPFVFETLPVIGHFTTLEAADVLLVDAATISPEEVEIVQKRCPHASIFVWVEAGRSFDWKPWWGAANGVIRADDPAEHQLLSLALASARREYSSADSTHWVDDALRHSERRFREIVFSMAGWIWECDRDWILTYSSDNVIDYLGFNAQDMVGQSLLALCQESRRQAMAELLLNASEEDNPLNDLEFWVDTESRGTVCLLINGEIKEDGEGHWVGFRGVAKDITHQKRIEMALKASEEKYRNWFQNTEVGMVRLRTDSFTVEAANQKFAQLLNVRAEDLVSGEVEIPWERMNVKREELFALRQGEHWIDREVKLKLDDGSERTLLSTVHWHEHPQYIEASMVDISTQKAAELALRQSNERLRELDQMKSEFLSTVSHELRTPIAIMGEGVSLCLDEIVGPLNMEQRDLLEDTHQNVGRLSRLISDLLDVSRIEAGKVVLRKSRFDMVKVVNQALDGFRPQADQKQIALKYNGPQTLAFFADADKFRQILDNLISNALRFTQAGSITVSLSEDDDFVHGSVADTGIGIAPKDLERLFSKFAQIGRVDGPGYKGTGLGLTIVKGMVEKHGGSVSVTSEPGRGSAFAFTLKRMIPPRIALVETDSLSRALAELLEEAGYEVESRSIWSTFSADGVFDMTVCPVDLMDAAAAEATGAWTHGLVLYARDAVEQEVVQTLEQHAHVSVLTFAGNDAIVKKIQDLMMG